MLVPLPQPNIRVTRADGAPDQHYALYWLSLDGAVRKPPIATITSLGVVQPDGTSIGITAGGIISTIPGIPNLSSITNSLGADVALNNVANYFDGPSVAQGSTGTWFVSGTVSVVDTSAGSGISTKLWDGTTIIASARSDTVAANSPMSISLSGVITSPAGNLRISVRDTGSTSGKILFNDTGNSKDSTITAIRIG